MDFTALICHHALSRPEKPAIILPDRVVTYRMVAQGIFSVIRRLADLRLPPGVLVAVAIESPIRHLIVASALFRLGHPSLSVRRTRDIPAIKLPLGLILEGSRDALVPGLNQVLVDDDWFAEPAPRYDAAPPRAFAGGDAVCRVELSSGTTGLPKAISLSVDALHQWIHNYYLSIGLGDWNRMLSLPGLSSSWGFSMAAHALSAGKTLCFASTARETLQMIALYRVDCLVGATQHLRQLVDEQRQNPVPSASLAVLFTGGSLLPSALLTESRARLCSNIVVQYGSTESGATAFAPSDRLSSIEGAVGFVAPWAEVQSVDEAGRILPRGTDGILRIRSTCQGRPYPEAAPNPDGSFRDGWFYPGDRGRVMEDGMLIVSGRLSEIINAGGTKLAPEAIEDVLCRHPAVADAAAFAGAGSSGIEEWAAVVPRGPFDAAQIIAFCAKEGVPVSRLIAVQTIPRAGLGKVERERLKREILARPND